MKDWTNVQALSESHQQAGQLTRTKGRVTAGDDGVTWSNAIQLAPSWSTDCGNPSAKQLSNGNVAVVFYTALGATNGTVGVEPSIIYLEFDPTSTKTTG